MNLKIIGLLVTTAVLSSASVIPGMGGYTGSVDGDAQYSSETDKKTSIVKKDRLTSSKGVNEIVDTVNDHTNIKQSSDATDMARELEMTSRLTNPDGTAEILASRETGRLQNGTDARGVNASYGKKEADLAYGILRPDDVSELYAVTTTDEANELNGADGSNAVYLASEDGTLQASVDASGAAKVTGNLETQELYAGNDADGSDELYVLNEDTNGEFMTDGKGLTECSETSSITGGSDAGGLTELFALNTTDSAVGVSDGSVDATILHHEANGSYESTDDHGNAEIMETNGEQNSMKIKDEDSEMTMDSSNTKNLYGLADSKGVKMAYEGNETGHSVGMKDRDGQAKISVNKIDEIYGTTDENGVDNSSKVKGVNRTMVLSDADGTVALNVDKVDEMHAVTDANGIKEGYISNAVDKTLMIGDGTIDDIDDLPCADSNDEASFSGTIPVVIDDTPHRSADNSLYKKDNADDLGLEDVMSMVALLGSTGTPSVDKKRQKPIITIGAPNAVHNEDNVDDINLATVMKLLGLSGISEAAPADKKKADKGIVIGSDETSRKEVDSDEMNPMEIMRLLGLVGSTDTPVNTKTNNVFISTGGAPPEDDSDELELKDIMNMLSLLGLTDPLPIKKNTAKNSIMSIGASDATSDKENADDSDLAAVMKLLGLLGTGEAPVIGSDETLHKKADTDEMNLMEIMNLLGLFGSTDTPVETKNTNNVVISASALTDPLPINKNNGKNSIITIGTNSAPGYKDSADDIESASIIDLLGLGRSEARSLNKKKAKNVVLVGAPREETSGGEMEAMNIMKLLGLGGVGQTPKGTAPRTKATDELDVVISLDLPGTASGVPVGNKQTNKPIVISANGATGRKDDADEVVLMDIMNLLGHGGSQASVSNGAKANKPAVSGKSYAPAGKANADELGVVIALDLLGMGQGSPFGSKKANKPVVIGAPHNKVDADEMEVMDLMSTLGLLSTAGTAFVNHKPNKAAVPLYKVPNKEHNADEMKLMNAANEADIIIEIGEFPRKKSNTNKMKMMSAGSPSNLLDHYEAPLVHVGTVSESVVVTAEDGPSSEANNNELEMKTAAVALKELANEITDLYESGDSKRLRQVFGGHKIKKMDLHVSIDMDNEKSPAYHDGKGPLFLTPYIESGSAHEGRSVALVKHTEMTEVTSYSGYLTVDKKYNSHLFFWFFPAKVNPEEAPVMLLLQGDPGISSLSGLFLENGPFRVTEDLTLKMRESSWTTTHNVIYIDNPVGTGYSFTEQEAGYRREEIQVSEDLYVAMSQFYQLFPEYRDNELYLAGESYAGQYIPSLASTIHKNNPTAKNRMNLQGIAIGNSFGGSINWQRHGHFHTSSEETVRLQKFMKRVDVKRAIHVGDREYIYESELIEEYLMTEVTKSGVNAVATPPEDYKVLIFSGQMDIIPKFTLGE